MVCSWGLSGNRPSPLFKYGDVEEQFKLLLSDNLFNEWIPVGCLPLSLTVFYFFVDIYFN